MVPVYNEMATLESAVNRVLNVKYPVEIELVIVDDESTNGKRNPYPQWAGEPCVVIHEKATNGGKGSAIRKGVELAGGDYLIMCDADLESPTEEIPSLLPPIIEERAPVVYGIRTFGSHNAYSYLNVFISACSRQS